MRESDAYETTLLSTFEGRSLKSVATNAELQKFKAAARASATKDQRVNIRLSSGDLQDIQVKALEDPSDGSSTVDESTSGVRQILHCRRQDIKQAANSPGLRIPNSTAD